MNSIINLESAEDRLRRQKVFDVSNAMMEMYLNCPFKKQDCFECGNAECFEVMAEQAELYGITFNEYAASIQRLNQESAAAAEAQRKRYEEYYRQAEHLKTAEAVIRKIQQGENKPEVEKGLFDFAA